MKGYRISHRVKDGRIIYSDGYVGTVEKLADGRSGWVYFLIAEKRYVFIADCSIFQLSN